MGSVKNLISTEAIKKIQELAKAADICMFTTNLSSRPLNTRPMSTQEIDEEGNLWFFSERESDKNHDIISDPDVQLFYENKDKFEFLSIFGQAEILEDRDKIKELWTPMVQAWFQQGKDDPNLTLIKVTPQEAYYWDTKNSKMVSFLKVLASVVVGKTMDDGIEGKLSF